MHTATQLSLSDFRIKQGGRNESPHRFLDWERRDRLGVIVDQSFGALGASTLMQLCIAAFFDCLPVRRDRPLYADAYLFHVGQLQGNFSLFDFWPNRREVVVPRNSMDLLGAINDYGITHVIVSDGPGNAARFHFKDEDAARDRIKFCWAYSSSGNVDRSNIEIVGLTSAVADNAIMSLSPSPVLASRPDANLALIPGYMEDFDRFMRQLSDRLDEVSPEQVAIAQRFLNENLSSGKFVQTFRSEDTEWLFQRLGGLAKL